MPIRDLEVAPGVTVPARGLRFRAVRASGPGGQNVNKVASRVELRVDLDAVRGLPVAARRRLEALTRGRRDAQGHWLVTSQRTREQGSNLEDALDKVRATVRRALIAPRPRHGTRPSAAARERRLAAKRARGRLKQGRATRHDTGE